ncbi:hypothetical protein BMS_0055 [Halobacteriovorax marinus SJ]|uniref:Uncharacterized protein n=1 Tax=Halobacteriovorax marinus (strain ATCC BAA-682 / DSM 15412 / SJ) TaxID=862908 RepID=E1X240_HALMS|nr:hypothetical protein [Halobacteriovorax marinus]CBW24996.1 hypothetical protein BMS_0055 [Halobacteriovorax marinus SJ]
MAPAAAAKETCMKYLKQYKSYKQHTKNFLESATRTSIRDSIEAVEIFIREPNLTTMGHLVKTLTNSGTWISHSTLRHLHAHIDFFNRRNNFLNDEGFQEIINSVVDNDASILSKYDEASIFEALYLELDYAHKNSEYQTNLKIPKIDSTLVLISGVFNEIFSTPAFERGARHLFKTKGIKYIAANVNGSKSSKHNSKLLAEQLKRYKAENPNEKLWLLCFSKGGLDTLHFLKNEREWAEENVIGVSTIASPILGSDHLKKKIFKMINSIHFFENTKLYQFFDQKIDIMMKEFQKSLSSDYQSNWFQRNHDKLPSLKFYSAIGLESEWYESHIWMVLTKLIFQSAESNDGVVDTKNSQFPDYFKGLNLGILKGHHLIGTRSSFYNQEALLETHLVMLDFLEKSKQI